MMHLETLFLNQDQIGNLSRFFFAAAGFQI